MAIFKVFKVGTIFNPLQIKIPRVKLKYKEIKIRFPSRLNAMALDPSKIAFNKNMVFKPGEIVFSVQIYKTITVKSVVQKGIHLSETTQRKTLATHAALIMLKALGIKKGLFIDVSNTQEIKHCGLGSSSSLIAGVACAINELYGSPIPPNVLIKYLAQNHGEEIDNKEDMIQQVQCIGGSAASGMFKGGLLVIAGESNVIKTMNVKQDYSVIIGIPEDFRELDAATLMEKEEANLPNFVTTGRRYGALIAYRILHDILPVMMDEGNLTVVGDLIYDYRFNMGSIKNCSFTYPKLISIANKLKVVKTKGIAEVLALSSVGPAFFAITKNTDLCKDHFEKSGLNVLTTKIENDKYRVLKRVSV